MTGSLCLRTKKVLPGGLGQRQRSSGQFKDYTMAAKLDAQGALGTNGKSLKLDFTERLVFILWVLLLKFSCVKEKIYVCLRGWGGGYFPSRGDSLGDSAENWGSRIGVWQARVKGTRWRGGQEPHGRRAEKRDQGKSSSRKGRRGGKQKSEKVGHREGERRGAEMGLVIILGLCRCLASVNTFSPHHSPLRQVAYCYSHFTNEEAEVEKGY